MINLVTFLEDYCKEEKNAEADYLCEITEEISTDTSFYIKGLMSQLKQLVKEETHRWSFRHYEVVGIRPGIDMKYTFWPIYTPKLLITVREQ